MQNHIHHNIRSILFTESIVGGLNFGTVRLHPPCKWIIHHGTGGEPKHQHVADVWCRPRFVGGFRTSWLKGRNSWCQSWTINELEFLLHAFFFLGQCLFWVIPKLQIGSLMISMTFSGRGSKPPPLPRGTALEHLLSCQWQTVVSTQMQQRRHGGQSGNNTAYYTMSTVPKCLTWQPKVQHPVLSQLPGVENRVTDDSGSVVVFGQALADNKIRKNNNLGVQPLNNPCSLSAYNRFWCIKSHSYRLWWLWPIMWS